MYNQPNIAVVAAIIEREGAVLLARRSRERDHAGLWEFPGGKVEPGETDAQALSRELREEFGVEVAVGEFVAVGIHDNGTQVIELRAYWARHLNGEFLLTDHDAIVWAPIVELERYPVPPADGPIVRALQQGSRKREAGTGEQR
jgi:(d)CTP diphosphatase